VGGQVGGSVYSSQPHAAVWNGETPVDLNPPTYYNSGVLGVGGGEQVGLAFLHTDLGNSHAILWTGSAGSYVVLDPAGYTNCEAVATNGSQQVGYGSAQAILWSGSAASYVNLNPTNAGYNGSEALGIDGSQEVGFAFSPSYPNNEHAALWSGTAASFVDLQPPSVAGYVASQALGVGGNQQVGTANSSGGYLHAMVWNGTAASYVDLNPAGFLYSQANGTNGTQQVGYATATSSSGESAALWNGSAGSFVNLQALLPSQFTSSDAFTIDAQGDVFGYAVNSDGSTDAIEWQVTPEPGSVSIMVVGGLGLLARRRRR